MPGGVIVSGGGCGGDCPVETATETAAQAASAGDWAVTALILLLAVALVAFYFGMYRDPPY